MRRAGLSTLEAAERTEQPTTPSLFYIRLALSLPLLSLSTDMSVSLLHVKNFPPMGPSDGTTSWKKNLDNGQLDQLMHIQYTRGELKKGLKVVNLFLHRFSAKKC